MVLLTYKQKLHGCCRFQLIQLCLSDPEQRPSLRQVRILLLHLLASKGSSQSSLFDQKWNQLMPKKPAQVIY